MKDDLLDQIVEAVFEEVAKEVAAGAGAGEEGVLPPDSGQFSFVTINGALYIRFHENKAVDQDKLTSLYRNSNLAAALGKNVTEEIEPNDGIALPNLKRDRFDELVAAINKDVEQTKGLISPKSAIPDPDDIWKQLVNLGFGEKGEEGTEPTEKQRENIEIINNLINKIDVAGPEKVIAALRDPNNTEEAKKINLTLTALGSIEDMIKLGLTTKGAQILKGFIKLFNKSPSKKEPEQYKELLAALDFDKLKSTQEIAKMLKYSGLLKSKSDLKGLEEVINPKMKDPRQMIIFGLKALATIIKSQYKNLPNTLSILGSFLELTENKKFQQQVKEYIKTMYSQEEDFQTAVNKFIEQGKMDKDVVEYFSLVKSATEPESEETQDAEEYDISPEAKEELITAYTDFKDKFYKQKFLKDQAVLVKALLSILRKIDNQEQEEKRAGALQRQEIGEAEEPQKEKPETVQATGRQLENIKADVRSFDNTLKKSVKILTQLVDAIDKGLQVTPVYKKRMLEIMEQVQQYCGALYKDLKDMVSPTPSEPLQEDIYDDIIEKSTKFQEVYNKITKDIFGKVIDRLVNDDKVLYAEMQEKVKSALEILESVIEMFPSVKTFGGEVEDIREAEGKYLQAVKSLDFDISNMQTLVKGQPVRSTSIDAFANNLSDFSNEVEKIFGVSTKLQQTASTDAAPEEEAEEIQFSDEEVKKYIEQNAGIYKTTAEIVNNLAGYDKKGSDIYNKLMTGTSGEDELRDPLKPKERWDERLLKESALIDNLQILKQNREIIISIYGDYGSGDKFNNMPHGENKLKAAEKLYKAAEKFKIAYEKLSGHSKAGRLGDLRKSSSEKAKDILDLRNKIDASLKKYERVANLIDVSLRKENYEKFPDVMKQITTLVARSKTGKVVGYSQLSRQLSKMKKQSQLAGKAIGKYLQQKAVDFEELFSSKASKLTGWINSRLRNLGMSIRKSAGEEEATTPIEELEKEKANKVSLVKRHKEYMTMLTDFWVLYSQLSELSNIMSTDPEAQFLQELDQNPETRTTVENAVLDLDNKWEEIFTYTKRYRSVINQAAGVLSASKGGSSEISPEAEMDPESEESPEQLKTVEPSTQDSEQKVASNWKWDANHPFIEQDDDFIKDFLGQDEVEEEDMLQALKGADEEVINKVLNVLSKRQAEDLRQKLEDTDIDRNRQKTAQQKINDLLAKDLPELPMLDPADVKDVEPKKSKKYTGGVFGDDTPKNDQSLSMPQGYYRGKSTDYTTDTRDPKFKRKSKTWKPGKFNESIKEDRIAKIIEPIVEKCLRGING